MDCDSSMAGLLHMHSAQLTSARQMSARVPATPATAPDTWSSPCGQPGVVPPGAPASHSPACLLPRSLGPQGMVAKLKCKEIGWCFKTQKGGHSSTTPLAPTWWLFTSLRFAWFSLFSCIFVFLVTYKVSFQGGAGDGITSSLLAF